MCLIFKTLFLKPYLYICVCICIWEYSALQRPEKMPDSLELELKAVGSPLVWMLGTVLESRVRAVLTLNPWCPFPASKHNFLFSTFPPLLSGYFCSESKFSKLSLLVFLYTEIEKCYLDERALVLRDGSQNLKYPLCWIWQRSCLSVTSESFLIPSSFIILC